MTAEAAAAAPRRRPIVPFLDLGDGADDRAHLVGYRCDGCGALYFSSRIACAKCTAEGRFTKVPLGTRGKLYVYTGRRGKHP